MTKKFGYFLPLVLLVLTGFLLFSPALTLADDLACQPSLSSLNLTTWAVVCGAALDAINPCEFAILILLMASMLYSGQSRKRALWTGLSFVAAIFVAYFAMGVSFFELIRTYTLSFSDYFYRIIGILAIILGLLNIKDFFWYGGGGFLMEVPQSWRPRMKGLVKRITSPWGAFLTGLLVSLFLLPCTSGPYVIILGMLAGKTTMAKAILYLILYNIIFVLPMLAIVFAVYFGLPPEKAEQWRQKKLRLLHLIAGIILLGLGVVILAGWI